MDARTAVSLACTVRDEADNIAALLDSMLDQSRPADEIVVNDCNSRDATAAIVERYIAAGHPIRLARGGHNIPSGRNNAVRHACGPLIACTDAGLTLDRHWLERIIAPLEQGAADVVGGFFQATPHSLFELVLGATNYRQLEEIDPDGFLPFGKSVAFRKDAWEQVGGYPEWASHCEDLLFALALQRAGCRFAFAPDALVYFQPRSSLRTFARQYFLYARGDGVANLWPRRHMIRYVTYAGAGLLVAAARRRSWLLGLLGLGAYTYVRMPLRRLHARAPALTSRDQVRAMALIPVIRLVGDVAKMAGYPVGVLRRLRSPALQQAIAEYEMPAENVKRKT
jgi:cellulose synthase/poly-beta-1,6-N-acetylglucosamine synthase-like glycosyltransferase